MGLDGVDVRDLYERYPEFDIDVEAEQLALADSDVVVLQFPMYWYSTPALLKQYQDLVLLHGWAYGTGGTALAGKKLICAISMGGKREAYTIEGFHGSTVQALLAPLRQTARLCKMTFLPPFLQHGAFQMTEEDVVQSALTYRDLLVRLRDDELDLTRIEGAAETLLTAPNTETDEGLH